MAPTLLLASPPPRTPLFRVLLPLTWAALCVFGFLHPGDDYLLFAVGSAAGIWGPLVLSGAGEVAGVLLPVLVAGSLLMLFFGWMLDRLHAELWLWALAFVGAAVLLMFGMLASYPDLDAAVQRHGSFLAFAACALQLGGYAAFLVASGAGLFAMRPEQSTLV